MKKLLILSITVLAFLSVGITNAAQNKATGATPKVPKQVIKVATSYASSIACNVEMNPNVITLVPHKNEDDIMDSKYAVLWHGDIGCAGGFGTVSTELSIVKVGAFNTYVVDPLQSTPVIEFEVGSRFESKIVSSTQNTIVLDTYESDINDPDCCPSISVRLTLAVDDKGNWKIKDRKQLPNSKK